MNAISPTATPAAASPRPRRARYLGAVLALLATGAAVLAPSADAALTRCSDLGVTGSDARSLCARVTGIDRGSTLKVRKAPSLTAPVVIRLRNNAVVEVDCWAKGPRVHGDPVWVGLYTAAGPIYVNDWYLTTGAPATWIRKVALCP